MVVRKHNWGRMVTHTTEDEFGRPFIHYHRDMGVSFVHVPDDCCICGPIRMPMDEEANPHIPKVCQGLDVVAHRMVN